MAKDPDDRYQSAGELAHEALAAIRPSSAAHHVPAPPPAPVAPAGWDTAPVGLAALHTFGGHAVRLGFRLGGRPGRHGDRRRRRGNPGGSGRTRRGQLAAGRHPRLPRRPGAERPGADGRADGRDAPRGRAARVAAASTPDSSPATSAVAERRLRRPDRPRRRVAARSPRRARRECASRAGRVAAPARAALPRSPRPRRRPVARRARRAGDRRGRRLGRAARVSLAQAAAGRADRGVADGARRRDRRRGARRDRRVRAATRRARPPRPPRPPPPPPPPRRRPRPRRRRGPRAAGRDDRGGQGPGRDRGLRRAGLRRQPRRRDALHDRPGDQRGQRRPIEAGTRPDHVVAGKGVVWVGAAGDDTVARFENGQRDRPSVKVGDRPEAIALGKQLAVGRQPQRRHRQPRRPGDAVARRLADRRRQRARGDLRRPPVRVGDELQGRHGQPDRPEPPRSSSATRSPSATTPRGVIETPNATWIANAEGRHRDPPGPQDRQAARHDHRRQGPAPARARLRLACGSPTTATTPCHAHRRADRKDRSARRSRSARSRSASRPARARSGSPITNPTPSPASSRRVGRGWTRQASSTIRRSPQARRSTACRAS